MGKKLLGIKAVGFDVDGTLYESTKEMHDWIYNQWVGDVARHLNVSFDAAQVLYDQKYEELRSNTETLNSFGLDGQAIAARLFDDIPLERYVSRDERLVTMIQNLKEQFRLFIISNGTKRQVLRKLKMLGLDPVDFDPLVCCYDHLGWNKPNPASFLYVAEKLNLKPGEIVYVGDREGTDIAAAVATGMRTIKIGLPKSKIADASCQNVYDVEQLFV